MFFGLAPSPAISQRLRSLENHLREEHPLLLDAVRSYRELDRVAYRMGLLERDQSYVMQIPWWPLISVLGTFSAGKSTFINNYLGYKLQATGNQAVDDKFTVICHSSEDAVHVLPGFALDADPRFPFYKISEEIDRVDGGEGWRIDAYMQLKTCPSESLRGKIIIDSPGFDADEQRTSTLRITEHIINLSDLVIVFFDARHPEPGAMRDTLDHLVAKSIGRMDSGKFLYVLNQIDTTAREDNPEEVFGAWQRALAQKGLTAGRFYTIYNPDAAVPIDDERLRTRFETKRDADLFAIHERIQQVELERSYRIISTLEKTARGIEKRIVPLLTEAVSRWRRRTFILDGVVFGLLALLALFLTLQFGNREGQLHETPWLLDFAQRPVVASATLAILVGAAVFLHFRLRGIASRGVGRWLTTQVQDPYERQRVLGGFARSTDIRHSLFLQSPAGWGRGARSKLHKILGETDRLVQQLNDTYANPSGRHRPPTEVATAESNVTPGMSGGQGAGWLSRIRGRGA